MKEEIIESMKGKTVLTQTSHFRIAFQIWVPHDYDVTITRFSEGSMKHLYPLKLNATPTRWKSVTQVN